MTKEFPEEQKVAFDLTIPATVLLSRLVRANQVTWSTGAGFRAMLSLLLV
jgi:hypothetical protein